jgi:hypothetical protein
MVQYRSNLHYSPLYTMINIETTIYFMGDKIMEELLWDFEEARKQIRKSVHGMRWLIRRRAIPMVRIGHRIYFQPEEIKRWIDEHSIPAQEGNKDA